MVAVSRRTFVIEIFTHIWSHPSNVDTGAHSQIGSQFGHTVSPDMVAELVEHGSGMREIVRLKPWSSQTND